MKYRRNEGVKETDQEQEQKRVKKKKQLEFWYHTDATHEIDALVPTSRDDALVGRSGYVSVSIKLQPFNSM